MYRLRYSSIVCAQSQGAGRGWAGALQSPRADLTKRPVSVCCACAVWCAVCACAACGASDTARSRDRIAICTRARVFRELFMYQNAFTHNILHTIQRPLIFSKRKRERPANQLSADVCLDLAPRTSARALNLFIDRPGTDWAGARARGPRYRCRPCRYARRIGLLAPPELTHRAHWPTLHPWPREVASLVQ